MELNNGLRAILKVYLDWNKPRLDCFVGMLLALMRIENINLAKLAKAFESDADVSSRYRRMQRFFSEVYFCYDSVAKLIVSLFDLLEHEFYLTLDRTNWKFGKININILMLGIVYRGAAIPVYWLILNKRGNSNQRERIALIKRFVKQFGKEKIKGILGDREFIGDDWLHYLNYEKIPYWMRIKHNMKIRTKRGKFVYVRSLFNDLRKGKSRILHSTRQFGTQAVWLSALRLDDDELLILASNRQSNNPFDIYGLRWEIETLFQCLKGRDFNMEDTRLVKYFRIKKIVSLLAIAFCWSLKAGEWKDKCIKPLKTKKHGRKEKSLFRYGLDYVGDILLANKKIHAVEVVRLLSLFLHPPQSITYEEGITVFDDCYLLC